MESHGAVLRCAACGKEWELDELGVLHARVHFYLVKLLGGETQLGHHVLLFGVAVQAVVVG